MITIENITTRLLALSTDMVQLGLEMQSEEAALFPPEFFPMGWSLVDVGRSMEMWARQRKSEYIDVDDPESQPDELKEPRRYECECVGMGRGGSHKCCDRAGEYNGFASGPTIFTCPEHCICHD